MRRNDFFKYLLLGGGGSESRSELESETLPYTFNSNSYKLRNYRIYGNTVDGESVGDLVETGEHTGEYLVPVTVDGKNLAAWDQNIVIDSSGAMRISSDAWGSIINVKNIEYIYLSGDIKKLNSNAYRIGLFSEMPQIGSEGIRITKSENGSVNVTNFNYCVVTCSIYGMSTTREDLLNEFMVTAGNTPPDAYEPYHAPITTNLYLPEQIKMVGDEAEYVDFKEQKQYFADGTRTDVTLPALPTLSGTNTLSVGTTVQPSKIWIQGNISEIETVSVQALQANMRSLQPLSLDDEDLELDVMPTDNDLQLDVKPIEKPVLNLNDVSEIENAEIERGIESAE